jgi:hypothetical protein
MASLRAGVAGTQNWIDTGEHVGFFSESLCKFPWLKKEKFV